MQTIDALEASIHNEFGLSAHVAAEIECYVVLPDESPAQIEKFWEPVEKAFRHEGLPILRIEKERGLHQYEIITQVTNPRLLAEALICIRAIIEKYAMRFDIPAYFNAKPFADQPSSGIHIHLHLSDGDGMNVYHKTEEAMSPALSHSLGGLLATMAGDMFIFFPQPADYARLDDSDHVPKIWGWGVNNRYCALRIPATIDPYNKRIEHRVACANADPDALIAAILSGVLHGLRDAVTPPAQEYGKHSARTMAQLALARHG